MADDRFPGADRYPCPPLRGCGGTAEPRELISDAAQDMLDELLARDHDLKMRDWEFVLAMDDKLKHGHSVNDAAARRIAEIHGRTFGERESTNG
jgi:hypothetical protein